MGLHLDYNVYHGVNAHLHSYLQNTPGWWDSFHNNYIMYLHEHLGAALPDRHVSLLEKSLQAWDIDYVETLDDEDAYQALVIVRVGADGAARPLTRIELLSPASKRPNDGADRYQARRMDLLKQDINLVELDYLHETRSPLDAVPDYATRAAGAYPYVIAACTPDDVHCHFFRVDDTIPTVQVPLADGDKFAFDFDAPYQETYRRNRHYHQSAVDYAALPPAFDRYDAVDQAAIKAVMERAAQ